MALNLLTFHAQFNFSKSSKVFNINLGSLKSGEVHSNRKVFNLVNSAKISR